MTVKWPVAPEYAEAWSAQIAKDPLSASGVNVTAGAPSATQPCVTFTGWWIYLVPPSLWFTVPKQAKVALTALYRSGYRHMPQVINATDAELSAVENIGPRRLAVLRRWLP